MLFSQTLLLPLLGTPALATPLFGFGAPKTTTNAGAGAGTASTAAAAAGDFSAATQNGLVDMTACADKILIFARGTTETGNMGSVAGPPFAQALATKVGASSLAVQGVEYPADIPGFLAGGDATGSQTMADLTTQAVTQCPNASVFIAGYSQGGQLVHNAAQLLPADVSSKVAGAVIFGDPDNGQAVQGVSAAKTKVFCANGDNICAGGTLVLPPHLSYGDDADAAATFLAGL